MPISIHTNSINDAFIKIAEALNDTPDFISCPNQNETREILGAFVVIDNPYDRLVTNVHRRISVKYLIGEWLWYERGSNSLDEISSYSKFWENISDDNQSVNSAYGHRLLGINKNIGINQWEWAKQQLIDDKESRRAVMFIALPSDMKSQTKDFPCTAYLQFFIREDQLYLVANMRSNDLVLGFTYDAPSFTLFQEKMLLELQYHYPKLKMGKYIHIAGSMHVYEKHYGMIRNVIADKYHNLTLHMPRISDLEEIKVLQYNESIIRNKLKIKLKKLSSNFSNWCQDALLNENGS